MKQTRWMSEFSRLSEYTRLYPIICPQIIHNCVISIIIISNDLRFKGYLSFFYVRIKYWVFNP